MDNVLGCIAMAAITFPISYLVARTCLGGVIRLVNASGRETPGPRSQESAARL